MDISDPDPAPGALEDTSPSSPGPDDGSPAEAPSTRSARRTPLVVGLVVVLVGATLALVVTRSSGVALALDMSKGDLFRYRITSAMNGTVDIGGQSQPLSQTIAGDETWRVVSVDANGIATVEDTVSNLSVSSGGQPIQVDKSITIHLRIAPDGRILSGGDIGAAAGGAGAPTIPGGSQFTPLLPDHKVEPGDTWQKSFDSTVPIFDSAVHYSTSNTFLRYETVNGQNTVVIRSTMTVPMHLQLELAKLLQIAGITLQDAGLPVGSNPTISYSGTARVNGTYWLDPDHGQMVKASMTETPAFTMTFNGFPASQVPPGTTARFTGTFSLKLDPR